MKGREFKNQIKYNVNTFGSGVAVYSITFGCDFWLGRGWFLAWVISWLLGDCRVGGQIDLELEQSGRKGLAWSDESEPFFDELVIFGEDVFKVDVQPIRGRPLFVEQRQEIDTEDHIGDGRFVVTWNNLNLFKFQVRIT